MSEKTAIAMSGGVDSLVAAAILKEKDHALIGIHFKTGFENQIPDFTSIEKQLDIQVKVVDLSQQFKNCVVDYFTRTYLSGRTPNPCLICNKTIKFGTLFKAAQKHGAARLATGHYAGIKQNSSGGFTLVKGKDPIKEQSYFLSFLSQEQLARTLFPLENMTKTEVTAHARHMGLVPPDKKESQDICFIPQGNFFDFIQGIAKVDLTPGNIVTSDGKVVGRHQGLYRYTVGQRRGLNSPGPAPYYVKKIDMAGNRLVVGFKDELFTQYLGVTDFTWHGPPPTAPRKVTAKIRYSHPGAEALLSPDGINAELKFNTPQYAVTPGQGAAFYHEERLLGAGIIQSIIKEEG